MKKKIKVLILSSTIGLGGADKQIIFISKYLKEKYNIKVISLTPLGKMGYNALKDNCDIESLDLKTNRNIIKVLLNFIKLLGVILRFNPDIMLTFMFHATLIGRFCKFIGMVPLHISSVRSIRMGGRLRELIFKYSNMLDKITTINSMIAGNRLVERGVIEKRKLSVIPNGIETQVYVNASKNNSKSYKPFTWIIVARTTIAKDYNNLLDAVNLLRKRHSNFKIISIGKGNLFKKVMDRASELNLDNYIDFKGR